LTTGSMKHVAAGGPSEADDLVALSGLQHLIYCERQAALIHVERLWAEDVATAEGRLMHERADLPGADNRRGVRVERAVTLRSDRLGVAGRADVVEYHADASVRSGYLHKDHDRVVVRVERETRAEIPLLHLASVVCFGRVSVSPDLMAAMSEAGIHVAFFSMNGRFLARVEGVPGGNVLLRRQQYRAADDGAKNLAIARAMVIGKVANTRQFALHARRDAASPRRRTRSAPSRSGSRSTCARSSRPRRSPRCGGWRASLQRSTSGASTRW
jgi:CRISPR associated protein Cas1/Domain of unknown function DUF83